MRKEIEYFVKNINFVVSNDLTTGMLNKNCDIFQKTSGSRFFIHFLSTVLLKFGIVNIYIYFGLILF